MTKRRKIILSAVVLFHLLLLAVVFILPSILKTKVVEALQKESGRNVRIEKIRIRPFTMTIIVDGFAINAVEGSELIKIKEIKASVSPASIFKGAVVVSELTVTEPDISFGRTAPNRYNFSDIIELQQKKPKQSGTSKPFHFSLNNFKIVNGSITFDDRAVKGGKKHTVRQLEISIPVISNIPQYVETAATPHLSAIVNGSPFKLDGALKPFSKSMETALSVNLKHVNIPHYLSYIPFELPVEIKSGNFATSLEITYRVSNDKKPEILLKGTLGVNDILVESKKGGALVKLQSLEIAANALDISKARFQFDSMIFDRLELNVSRDSKGLWNYADLFPQKNAKVENKTDSSSNLKKESTFVEVKNFAVHNSSIYLKDSLPKIGFKTALEQIDLDVTGFSTAQEAKADYELSLLMDDQTDIAVGGAFTPTNGNLDADVELSGGDLSRFWPYYSDSLTHPLKGIFGVNLHAKYAKKQGVEISNLNLNMNKFIASYGDKEKLQLGVLNLKNGHFSTVGNRFEAQFLGLSQIDMDLSKEGDGSISILSLLKKKSTDGKVGAVNSNSHKKDEKQFSWKLGKLLLDRCNIGFTDKSRSEMPKFRLNKTALTLENLEGPVFKPAKISFSSIFNKSTPLSIKGLINPSPFYYKGSVNVDALLLRDFESYFPGNINVFLVGGSFDSSLDVDISMKDGKTTGSYKGKAGLRSFHIVDTKAEEDLLKWESLQLDDLQGSLEPFSLALHQIALNNVYSRIIIRKDGTLNLQNLVEKDEKTVEKPLGQSVNLEKTGNPEKTEKPKKQIRVDAVTIQDGTLAFTDSHLPQYFETTFFNLGGRVSGLSSEDSKFADVDLRGNLENHSPLQITGSINPLRDDLFVDLKVSFRDIELSPITPYTATFLGYPVEKGKLFLDLKYHIDKKQLDSENKVFIDQFTLGDKVESDKATSLPVKLGLALLKDRKGEIHLDLPVTGRTDDPKFSIWGVVWQVVKNVLVKAVTSPFSLLSSMFGSSEDFSSVQFESGTALLSQKEDEKIATLSKALLDRPALKMELKGYVDREKDPEGYRFELLQRKVKNEKALSMSAEGTVVSVDKIDSITFTKEEYPKLLTAVYKKEKFPKPRNAIGMVKELSPEEMQKLIITNTVIGDKELQSLARERVVAVFNALINKGKVPVERIFQKNDDVFKPNDKKSGVASRVEINAIAQ